jgi:hypothetical protein
VVEVDPASPDAWRKAPFHDTFKTWAARGAAQGLTLNVLVGRRGFEILPDRDVDHGLVREIAGMSDALRPVPGRQSRAATAACAARSCTSASWTSRPAWCGVFRKGSGCGDYEAPPRPAGASTACG